MAINNVPVTLPADFLILLRQFSSYTKSIVESTAGPQPKQNVSKAGKYSKTETIVTMVLNEYGDKANNGLYSFWRSYIVPINPRVTANDPGSFDSTYKDANTWKNYFFTLRIQLLTAVGANSDDPVIKAMDDVWNNIRLISGQWVVKTIPNESRIR